MTAVLDGQLGGQLGGHRTGQRLSAFVDGELPAAEADRFRAHLLSCSLCSQAVASERAVRERVRASCVPTPSHELLASLRVVAADAPAPLAPPPARRGRRGPLVLGVAGVLGTGTAAAVVGLAALPAATVADGEPTVPPRPAAVGRSDTPDVLQAGFGSPAGTWAVPRGATASPTTSSSGSSTAALAQWRPSPVSSVWVALTPPRR